MKQAIILCSGGIDSTVVAHYVKNTEKYDKLKVLFFNYNQKSLIAERKCAKLCSKAIKADFSEIALPELSQISNSLINKPGKSEIRRKELRNTREEGKKWYVPCRNLIFLSYAMAISDSDFIKNKIKSDIFVGFKCEGSEFYPDSSPEFLKEMNKLSKTSTESKPNIIAPLINKDKEDIILLGNSLSVDFKNTFSCYISKSRHCGSCLACMLRKEGFHWANIKDTTHYKN